MRVGPKRRWGTWEELILGGAVIRHGTRDWNVVASELRARTVHPYGFTPEVCKAKYEDLQRRYSGCTAWFEELRKRRVAELKRELEKSEDSIGSLESKLESLKAKKGSYNKIEYDSSQTESPLVLPKTVVSSGKDGLSAGSYTLDSCTPETDAKPLALESEPNKDIVLRKRRGKRKRKEIKEESIEESDNFGSTNLKETSTSECGQIVRSTNIDSQDLMEIFNSVAENKHALCFRRRLDSQRARYKKIIRQHMDLETIRSRISNRTIRSSGELFRDMLLLANNALVFYSRRTREYKSALTFRDLVSRGYHNKVSSSTPCLSPMMTCNLPVRPRSARPRPCKSNLLTKIPESNWSGINNLSNFDSIRSFVMAKKSAVVGPEECVGFGRAGKKATDWSRTPVTKERKRVRQRS